MKKYGYVILIVLISLFIIFQVYVEYKKQFPENYKVTFFDISLGDSILIQTPKGKTILIDSGANSDISQKLSQILSFFDKTIDIFILSHGDDDHAGGINSFLKHYKIGQIFFNGADKQTPIYDEFESLIKNKNISFKILESSHDFFLDKNIFLDTIFPFKNISYLENHGNDESLVFKIDLFGKRILFTGDIEQEIEEEILLSGENLKSDILKLAHHGSKTSSTQAFLNAVRPKYAIAQANLDNKFGHPHKEVIERLKTNNIQFLQTGIAGNITFCINEKVKEFFRCND